MNNLRYIWGILFLLLCMTACHYRTTLSSAVKNGPEDSVAVSVQKERPYALNSNFRVIADTLWLRLLPLLDSIPVREGDELVVAEISLRTEMQDDSVWVKVARDQETIGWIPEHQLLTHIVPVDPISRCIHLFSNSHTLPFFLVLAVFFLCFVYRAVRRKQIKLIWLNDIDSVFFILLLGVALLDDLFHQTSFEVAFFYLLGLASYCIFLYIFFTYLWVYLAYVGFIGYTLWCIRQLQKSHGYPYACGSCGAKMRSKGICPHCGALNE